MSRCEVNSCSSTEVSEIDSSRPSPASPCNLPDLPYTPVPHASTQAISVPAPSVCNGCIELKTKVRQLQKKCHRLKKRVDEMASANPTHMQICKNLKLNIAYPVR